MASSRFEKNLWHPDFPNALVIARSADHNPGGIFTPEVDYKTRFFATYAIDNKAYASSVLNEPSPIKTEKDQLISKTAKTTIEPPFSEHVHPDSFYNVPPILFPTKKLKNITSKSDPFEENSQYSTNNIILKPIARPVAIQTLKGSKFTITKPHTKEVHKNDSTSTNQLHGLYNSSSTPNHQLQYQNSLPPHHHDYHRHNHSSASQYQIHSRMMGWKLTSPERRNELLNLLANNTSVTTLLTIVDSETSGAGKLHAHADPITDSFEELSLTAKSIMHNGSDKKQEDKTKPLPSTVNFANINGPEEIETREYDFAMHEVPSESQLRLLHRESDAYRDAVSRLMTKQKRNYHILKKVQKKQLRNQEQYLSQSSSGGGEIAFQQFLKKRIQEELQNEQNDDKDGGKKKSAVPQENYFFYGNIEDIDAQTNQNKNGDGDDPSESSYKSASAMKLGTLLHRSISMGTPGAYTKDKPDKKCSSPTVLKYQHLLDEETKKNKLYATKETNKSNKSLHKSSSTPSASDTKQRNAVKGDSLIASKQSRHQGSIGKGKQHASMPSFQEDASLRSLIVPVGRAEILEHAAEIINQNRNYERVATPSKPQLTDSDQIASPVIEDYLLRISTTCNAMENERFPTTAQLFASTNGVKPVDGIGADASHHHHANAGASAGIGAGAGIGIGAGAGANAGKGKAGVTAITSWQMDLELSPNNIRSSSGDALDPEDSKIGIPQPHRTGAVAGMTVYVTTVSRPNTPQGISGSGSASVRSLQSEEDGPTPVHSVGSSGHKSILKSRASFGSHGHAVGIGGGGHEVVIDVPRARTPSGADVRHDLMLDGGEREVRDASYD